MKRKILAIMLLIPLSRPLNPINDTEIKIKTYSTSTIRSIYEFLISPITKTMDGTKCILEASKTFIQGHPTEFLNNLWKAGKNYYIAGIIFYFEMLTLSFFQKNNYLWESSTKLIEIIFEHLCILAKNKNFQQTLPIFLEELIKPIIILIKKVSPAFAMELLIKTKETIYNLLAKQLLVK